MVFHWSLINSKSPQVSRTLHSILAVLNNAVVWIVSTRPPTTKFNNPLVTASKASILIGTIVTFMFRSFSNSLARSRYWSVSSIFFQFYTLVSRDSKVHNFQMLLLSLLLLLRFYTKLHFCIWVSCSFQLFLLCSILDTCNIHKPNYIKVLNIPGRKTVNRVMTRADCILFYGWRTVQQRLLKENEEI